MLRSKAAAIRVLALMLHDRKGLTVGLGRGCVSENRGQAIYFRCFGVDGCRDSNGGNKQPVPVFPAVIATVAVAVVAFSILWKIQYASAAPLGSDIYYHLKFAEITAQRGVIQEFPWCRFSIFKDHFADEFLHRVLLAGVFPEIGGAVFINTEFKLQFGLYGVQTSVWNVWTSSFGLNR